MRHINSPELISAFGIHEALPIDDRENTNENALLARGRAELEERIRFIKVPETDFKSGGEVYKVDIYLRDILVYAENRVIDTGDRSEVFYGGASTSESIRNMWMNQVHSPVRPHRGLAGDATINFLETQHGLPYPPNAERKRVSEYMREAAIFGGVGFKYRLDEQGQLSLWVAPNRDRTSGENRLVYNESVPAADFDSIMPGDVILHTLAPEGIGTIGPVTPLPCLERQVIVQPRKRTIVRPKAGRPTFTTTERLDQIYNDSNQARIGSLPPIAPPQVSTPPT